MTFKELGLNGTILEAISFMGFESATPIQEKAIPIILAGRDILACAQTGTGKTAAFTLPVINRLSESPGKGTRVLVIAPTRELAVQIDQQILGYSYFAGISSIAIYGGGDGQDFNTQKEALVNGTDIIIATPGKLISHLNMGYVDFSKIEVLILDEADRMLDMGFYEDIQRIVKHIPAKRQTLLFSATMPPKIRQLAKSILQEYDEIRLSVSKPAEGVLQAAYLVHDYQKPKLVLHLIDDRPNYMSILIFTGTKKKVQDIVRVFSKCDYTVKAVSSDLEQSEREDALKQFKSQKIRVLVATDVLSRGIDIKGINLVINYDVPGDAEDYVHRVGRTARADSTGVALTFINEDDMHKFQRIENLIEAEILKLPIPAEIGEGPEWNSKPGRRPQQNGERKSFSKKNGSNRSSGSKQKSNVRSHR